MSSRTIELEPAGLTRGLEPVGSPAAASDAKYFNGAFCRPTFEFGQPDLSALADYSTNGSVANAHPMASMNFVCPIVRDNWRTPSGIRSRSATSTGTP